MEIAFNFSSFAPGADSSTAGQLNEIYSRELGEGSASGIYLRFDSNDRVALQQAQDFFGQLPAKNSVTVTIFVVAMPGVQAIDEVMALHSLMTEQAGQCRLEIVLSDQVDGFDFHAQRSNALHAALNLYRQLQSHSVSSRWLIPLTPELVFRLEGLVSVAREESVDVLLVPADIVDSASDGLNQLSADQRLFAWDFITYRILESDRDYLPLGHRDYYQQLLALLQRESSNPVQQSLLVFSGSESGWQSQKLTVNYPALRDSALAPVVTGVEPISRWQKLATIAADLMDVASVGGRGHLMRTLVRKPRDPSGLAGRSLPRILLIGAYGGEHIGDAAILGGVLLRMHRNFGSVEAVLMTQRLNHTRHLMPMLEVPVDVSVDIYECEQIRRYVEWCDCVVFAGGPLIDLPKQLVRHIYTVSLAKRAGKPFIAEGIGPGPFARMPSRFTARRLIEMADRISLRAADAAEHELVVDRDFEVGLCPAFDYLETRTGELSRMPASEVAEIEQLLVNTEGRPVIGINIRPIGYLYTHGAPDEDVAGYTRRIEARFEDRLVEGLRKFSDKAEIKPCFVFFPMNAIQFGMSDLRSAYRIQQRLKGDVDFRIWQGDASLDGVLALIRKLDVAITMRFHAAIFALSQQCKVIGIDYRIGKKDKVAGLLEDVGQKDNCARIDLLTGRWLVDKLRELLR